MASTVLLKPFLPTELTAALLPGMVRCKHEGCRKVVSDILLENHERECEFLPEAENPIDDTTESDAARVKRTKENIMKHMPNLCHSITPDGPESVPFIEYIVLPTDTIQGIALRYGTTPADILRFNKLITSSSTALHQKAVIKVPIEVTDVLPSVSEKDLEKVLRSKVIGFFKARTGCEDNREAVYYLEEACFDLDEAILAYKDDLRWEMHSPSCALRDRQIVTHQDPSSSACASTPSGNSDPFTLNFCCCFGGRPQKRPASGYSSQTRPARNDYMSIQN